MSDWSGLHCPSSGKSVLHGIPNRGKGQIWSSSQLCLVTQFPSWVLMERALELHEHLLEHPVQTSRLPDAEEDLGQDQPCCSCLF